MEALKELRVDDQSSVCYIIIDGETCYFREECPPDVDPRTVDLPEEVLAMIAEREGFNGEEMVFVHTCTKRFYPGTLKDLDVFAIELEVNWLDPKKPEVTGWKEGIAFPFSKLCNLS